MVIIVWYEAPLTVYLLRFLSLPSVIDFSVSAAPMPEALWEPDMILSPDDYVVRRVPDV